MSWQHFLCILFYFHAATAVTNLQSLGNTFMTTNATDGRTGSCATSGFSCTFSESSCPYGGTEENTWMKTQGVPDQSLWSSSVATASTPDPPAIAVQLTETNPFGSFVSDPITCQDADGQVMFSFWSTKNVILQVCAVDRNTNHDIMCSENFNQNNSLYPGPFTFKLPQPIKDPFVIRFTVSAPPEENFAVLDELAYFGSGCSSGSCISGSINGTNTTVVTTTTSSTSEIYDTTSSPVYSSSQLSTTIASIVVTVSKIETTSTKSVPTLISTSHKPTFRTTTKVSTIANSNECQVIPCDFEKNWCQYSNLPASTIQWQRMNSGFGSPLSRLTDIQPNGGYFLATMIKANNVDVSILQSSELRLNSEKNMKFKYYRATMGSTIKICLETDSIKFVSVTSMKECQSVIPPLDKFNARIWNEATIALNRNVTKIYMVAVHEAQSSGNAAIAIDQISMTDCQ